MAKRVPRALAWEHLRSSFLLTSGSDEVSDRLDSFAAMRWRSVQLG
jgi:hypothetical protein